MQVTTHLPKREFEELRDKAKIAEDYPAWKVLGEKTLRKLCGIIGREAPRTIEGVEHVGNAHHCPMNNNNPPLAKVSCHGCMARAYCDYPSKKD